MEQRTQMGMNKTGVQMSPKDIQALLKDVKQTSAPGTDDAGIAAVRTTYITEAEPIGTVPVPGTVKGAVKTGMNKLTGKNPEVFIDALGARLAFERSGVRLYDTFLTKFQAMQDGMTELTADEIKHFRDEEAKHFMLLSDCLETLGADPTAQTPAADITGVESMGLMKVLEDPRTTLEQSLHALLVVELADNASWELLVTLAEDQGQQQMADKFRTALQEEEDHLAHVRQWYEQCVRDQAT